jgi:HEPN domain-containing protein
MNGAEPQQAAQWEEALRWLAKAAEDLAAARVLAREDVLDPAAFHIQQALEKLLKALLVAAAEDVRRTHDLESLAAVAHKHWPALIPSPFPLAYLGRWYLTSRYPDLDEAPPACEEISEALGAVEALLTKARSHAPADLRPDDRPARNNDS